MNAPSRRAEYFAMEANDYLAELGRLAGRSETPDLERLVRGARALRGAALMAGLGTFARAAAALEGLARQVRDHALGWDPEVRAVWRESIETLRGLVDRAAGWESADDRHALVLADRIERIGRGEIQPVSPPGSAASSGLTPGVRAFIARESALIAGTLQEAARALEPTEPPVALAAVLDRLRSLRGIGASTELSPLPELLDAMELTTRRLLDPVPVPRDLAAVFAEAAVALSEMAHSVGERGKVSIPPGLDLIARRLLAGFVAESDVVMIDSLSFEDQSALLERGNIPAQTTDPVPVPIELVGIGDLLLNHADALAAQHSPVTRDLRLFVIHQTLAALSDKSGTTAFLAPLARAIAKPIATGAASNDTDRFVEMLRECGRFLVENAGETGVDRLAAGRDALARRIQSETPAGDPMVRPQPTVVEPPVIGIDALAPDQTAEPAVINIDDLAPDQPVVPPVIDIDTLAPDQPAEPAVINIDDLAPDQPVEPPVIDIDALAPDQPTGAALINIDDLAPDDIVELPIVAIADLAPDPPGAAEIVDIADLAPSQAPAPSRLAHAFHRLAELGRDPGRTTSQLEPASINDLVYRGSAAMARIGELRRELNELLLDSVIDLDRLKPVLEELLDLVPLARNAA